jgi:hypothetical protein
VVNKVPRASSVCDDAENWQDALKDFILEMRRWMKSNPPNVDAVALKKHLQMIEDDYVNVTPDRLSQDNCG